MAAGIGMGMDLATELTIGVTIGGRAIDMALQVPIGVTMRMDLGGPVGFDGHGDSWCAAGSGWNATAGKR